MELRIVKQMVEKFRGKNFVIGVLTWLDLQVSLSLGIIKKVLKELGAESLIIFSTKEGSRRYDCADVGWSSIRTEEKYILSGKLYELSMEIQGSGWFTKKNISYFFSSSE